MMTFRFKHRQAFTPRSGERAALIRRLGTGGSRPIAEGIAPARTCQFPEGDQYPYVFCGAPTVPHPSGAPSPYCAEHRAKCYVRYAQIRDEGSEP